MSTNVGDRPAVVLGRGHAPGIDATPITYAHFGPADRTKPYSTVVLSHGAGGNRAVWFQQVPALAKHFDVLTWDHRGFGTTPTGPGPCDVEQSARDLTAILDHVGVSSPVHLVGQSMGGWTTTAFLLAAPERVASVVWSDTIAGMFTPALRAAYERFAAGTPSDSRSVSPERTPTPVASHPALEPTFSASNPELGLLYQELGAFAQPPMSQVRDALTNWSVDPQIVAKTAHRKLMIVGEHDSLFPASGIEELANLLDSEFQMIPGTGHSPYFEAPKAFNVALLSFLLNAAP